MFELFDVVKIKRNGVIGTIIDKTVIDGRTEYIVESNTKGEVEGAYGGLWPEYDCVDDDLIALGAGQDYRQEPRKAAAL